MSNTVALLTAAVVGFGPFPTITHPVTSEAKRPEQAWRPDAGQVAYTPWRLYRASVGSFQGPRCPHTPSCSAYALEAVRREGLVLGGAIAAHRLFRGARSSSVRLLLRDPSGRWMDTLEDATFWFRGSGR